MFPLLALSSVISFFRSTQGEFGALKDNRFGVIFKLILLRLITVGGVSIVRIDVGEQLLLSLKSDLALLGEDEDSEVRLRAPPAIPPLMLCDSSLSENPES